MSGAELHGALSGGSSPERAGVDGMAAALENPTERPDDGTKIGPNIDREAVISAVQIPAGGPVPLPGFKPTGTIDAVTLVLAMFTLIKALRRGTAAAPLPEATKEKLAAAKRQRGGRRRLMRASTGVDAWINHR